MYTEQHAIDRLMAARPGSLDPEKINPNYLVELKFQVQRWLDDINDAINKDFLNGSQ